MTDVEQRFVQHFGEMGSRWGINRTVGQIYALLYLSERPLNADEIAEHLDFSRSNVSMGLKELESWQLVRLQHHAGDRKEYYSTPDDVWAIFRTLAAEKRKREIDPTLSMLREAMMEAPSGAAQTHALQRIRAMHDLIELTSRWFDDVQRLDTRTLTQLMRLGSRVQRLLEARNRMSLVGSRRGSS
jgi:DNA-binding transcriptional regulator GbsR (MarR family)